MILSPPGYSGPISNNINSEFIRGARKNFNILKKKKLFVF